MTQEKVPNPSPNTERRNRRFKVEITETWTEYELRKEWHQCVNQASPRHGLLTFEHQGCQHFTGPEDRLGPDNVRSVG